MTRDRLDHLFVQIFSASSAGPIAWDFDVDLR
jgi:hypothetical protein